MSFGIAIKFSENFWPSDDATCLAYTLTPLNKVAALCKNPIFCEDGQPFVLLWLEGVGPVSFVQEDDAVLIFVDARSDLFRTKEIMMAVLPSGIDVVWPPGSEL
ncbi:MAG TPA: hypothetical protein DHC76_17435 [Rhodobacteraceae bacterium]|uniref:hypothetical protein n=1 Tax=Planktotalea sp. TaxID=2029877 RepID=UPI0005943CBD|nr:hypothetical protein [Planktotalea sp.]MDG1086029.1 hypothetical protein [Planktotalea sp.]HCW85770.1 hypothetical protein [Paracoccaceae bacterium]